MAAPLPGRRCVMKTLLSVCVAVLVGAWATGAFAGPDPCQIQHKIDIANCTASAAETPGLDLKACLTDARLAFKACQDGGGADQCVTDCDGARDDAFAECSLVYDVTQCFGDPGCEEFVLNLKAQCEDAAEAEHLECVGACSPT